jgi:hypothetical protein
MKKSHLILFIGGVSIAVGMILLLYYGPELIRQGVTFNEGVLNGTTIEVTKELDPSIKNTGRFFVVIKAFESGDLVAIVFDPNDNQLVKRTIQQEKTEEEFKINTKGQYKIVLENSGVSGNPFMLGLSHTPDNSIIAISYFGFWMIVSGFITLGIAAIYEIKIRKKKVS